MRRIPALLIMSCWLSMGQAQAEVEPVDKNFGGPYVGGQMVVGQLFRAGTGSPGSAFLLGADVGFGIKRDTWNRIELGAEFDTGQGSFSQNSRSGEVKVDVDLNMVAMMKAGYGYSLGDNAFGTFRIGLGVVQAGYTAKVGGVSATDESSGTAAMIAWDGYYPATQTLDLLAGASYRIFSVKFEDQDSMQLSFPGLYMGARLRL